MSKKTESTEIEITPEMIEAGKAALLSYGRDLWLPEETVSVIFLAMTRAMATSANYIDDSREDGVSVTREMRDAGASVIVEKKGDVSLPVPKR